MAIDDRTEALDDHANLTTEEARQGVTGNGVRYVLGYGILLAILAMAVTAMLAL